MAFPTAGTKNQTKPAKVDMWSSTVIQVTRWVIVNIDGMQGSSDRDNGKSKANSNTTGSTATKLIEAQPAI